MSQSFSKALRRMQISRSARPNLEDSTAQPIYTPLPERRPRSKLFGKQNDSAIPREYIRLLKILPGKASSIVECELQVVRLDKSPPYEALSYVWGNPDPVDYIICNGQRKAVTPNLGVALKHLRLENKSRVVWIDAICICQDDVEERSQQVGLMRDIYSRTGRVVAWLGEDEEDQAEAAIYIIENLAWEISQRLQMPIEDIRGSDVMELDSESLKWKDANINNPLELSGVLSTLSTRDRDAVVWFFSHTWFGRVWVIQEVAFAPAVMHIGARQLAWKTAAVAAWWLKVTNRHSGTWLSADFDFVSKAQDMFLLVDFVGSDYCQLLLAVTRFRSTDPRDMIFAILGLSQDMDRFNPDFQPDYTKDVADVYSTSQLLSVFSLISPRHHIYYILVNL
jgi:hypothetical protein